MQCFVLFFYQKNNELHRQLPDHIISWRLDHDQRFMVLAMK